jgi:hypothetical protein
MSMVKVDRYIASLPEWQQANLTSFSQLVHETVPDIQEEFKWNVPVFMLGGKMIFAMSAFKAHTKYNFIGNGAQLADPDKLFNNGFDSKKSRAIDLHEGESVGEQALRSLIKASAELF